ncbi:MAG: cyclase family protein [Actinomycetota bacterium]|nr:cyclase family protein [Actinomycetota bacterium]
MSADADGDGWIDVSAPIKDGMLHWPGDAPVKIEAAEAIQSGDPANVTRLGLSAHTGTHVDAPVHFFDGAPGIDTMPVAAGVGPARVVEITDPVRVRADELKTHEPRDGERLILKTQNSNHRWPSRPFAEDFVHLEPDAARLLARCGVRSVGVDYLSVGGFDDGEETHRALLAAGIWIIEGLDLFSVEPGSHDLMCLPLRLKGADGAPARAFLRPA